MGIADVSWCNWVYLWCWLPLIDWKEGPAQIFVFIPCNDHDPQKQKHLKKKTKCMCNVGCFSGTYSIPSPCFLFVGVLEFSSFCEVWTVQVHIFCHIGSLCSLSPPTATDAFYPLQTPNYIIIIKTVTN